MAPKKQKMALGAFLADETTGTNWADEMDDMPLQPGDFEEKMGSAFGARRGGPPGAGDRPSYGGRDGGYGGMDRDARPPRPDVPFPTQPPWTAFVGNMSFECSADEVKDFFSAENITANNVRLVTEFGGKSKGFCYVEFPEAEMLKSALALSGAQLGGRTVRISVAEAPRGGDSGRSAGDWTRSGPLADLPGRSGPRPGSGDRFGSGDRYGASTPPVMDSNRDWGDARGSKFAPSQPSSPGMGSRSTFGERREPSGARMGMGFGSGAAGGARDRDFSAASSSSGPVDDGRDWSAMRGGRFEATQAPAPKSTFGSDRRAPERSTGQVEETRDWRARTAPSSPPSESVSAAPAAPVERKKLQLAARSSSGTGTDVQSPDADSATPTSATRSSIFGGAAPVDTAAKEAAIAEKLRKQQEEAEAKRLEQIAARKAAAEAAAADKPALSNPFGEAKPVDATAREKEVEEKLAKDQAELSERMKDASLAEKTSPPAPQQREWRRAPGATNGAPKSQDNAPAQQQQRYNKPSNNQNPQRRDREASASSSDPSANAKPAQPSAPRQFSKDQSVRKQGFSYSMASKSQAAAETSASVDAGTSSPSLEAPAVAALTETEQ